MGVEERVLEQQARGLVEQPRGIAARLRQRTVEIERLADRGRRRVAVTGPCGSALESTPRI
jgi:hypothetical protein